MFWQKIFDSVSNVEMFSLSINFWKEGWVAIPLPLNFLFPRLIEPLRILLVQNPPSAAACVRETGCRDPGTVCFKDRHSFGTEMCFSRSDFLFSLCVLSPTASTDFNSSCTVGALGNGRAAWEEMLSCSHTSSVYEIGNPGKQDVSTKIFLGGLNSRHFSEN